MESEFEFSYENKHVAIAEGLWIISQSHPQMRIPSKFETNRLGGQVT